MPWSALAGHCPVTPFRPRRRWLRFQTWLGASPLCSSLWSSHPQREFGPPGKRPLSSYYGPRSWVWSTPLQATAGPSSHRAHTLRSPWRWNSGAVLIRCCGGHCSLLVVSVWPGSPACGAVFPPESGRQAQPEGLSQGDLGLPCKCGRGKQSCVRTGLAFSGY